ncbi:MAG: Xaa-Pro peptidase family protein [Desulfobacterales bacterium]
MPEPIADEELPEEPSFRVPAAEIEGRLARLREALRAEGLEAAFLVQAVDRFYFSGTAQDAFLHVPAEGPALLFVRRFFPRAREESPLAEIVPIDSVRRIPELLKRRFGRLPARLGLELDVLPVNEFRFFRDLLAPQVLSDISPAILRLRSRKSDWEIAQLEATAEMSRRTFDFMRRILAPGITEMEFAARAEAFSRRLGHAGMLRVRGFNALGYPGHVLSGPNGGRPGMLDAPASGSGTSCAFPAGAGPRRLRRNEPILVDFGSVKNGYHLDEARMFAVGDMPGEALAACRAAIDLHDRLIAAARPGVTGAALFEQAVALAEQWGYGDSFLGPPGHKVRFVGHGIGLELVEPPFLARGRETPLEENMVLAVEPKLVFEGRFAAGVESVFRVTSAGGRLLSRVPVEVFVC